MILTDHPVTRPIFVQYLCCCSGQLSSLLTSLKQVPQFNKKCTCTSGSCRCVVRWRHILFVLGGGTDNSRGVAFGSVGGAVRVCRGWTELAQCTKSLLNILQILQTPNILCGKKEMCNFIKYNYNTTSLHALININSNYMCTKDMDEF